MSENRWMHIAVNHDRSQSSIGRMRQVEYHLEVELFRPMSMEQLFNIFGGAGIMLNEATLDDSGNVATVSRFEIPEFSYCPEPLSRAPGTLGEVLLLAKDARGQ